MPTRPSHQRRVATALVAIAVTFGVHATWLSDLQTSDTRGPAIQRQA